ncbi:hypothetical protein HK405_001130, partial [Cladochytrium tenue]
AELFDLVADVDRYKEFVPWCVGSRVLTRRTVSPPPSPPPPTSTTTTNLSSAATGGHQAAAAAAANSGTPTVPAGTRTLMTAELAVGFQGASERYVSTVTCTHPDSVQAVASNSAVFKTLTTTWHLAPRPSGGGGAGAASCLVTFDIAFEFRSPLYAGLARVFFSEVCERTVQAFEDRAWAVYRTGGGRRQGGGAAAVGRLPRA